jgi:hypothetical protein
MRGGARRRGAAAGGACHGVAAGARRHVPVGEGRRRLQAREASFHAPRRQFPSTEIL